MTEELPAEIPEELPTLHLEAFDRHGTTRARFEGRWIEVEHGIPGETVLAEIFGGRRPRARIVEILEPAPDRVDPPCEYFRDWKCGGCQWQHISYEGQLQRKRDEVASAMRDAALPFSVTATHSLEDPWRYRTTAGIALGRSAGFRRHGSLAIVPIRDCPISHPAIGRLMAALNDALQSGTLPDFRGRVRLDVRLAESAAQSYLQVLIRLSPEGPVPGTAELDRLIAALRSFEMVGGIALLRPGRPIEVIEGDLFVEARVGDRYVTLTAATFFQTNVRLLPDLIGRLAEEAHPLAGKRVADTYGGVGIFGLFLADDAGEVVVIESDPLAIEAGRRTAATWGLSNVTFESGRAEDVDYDVSSFDVVIVDPPRTGLTQEMLKALTRGSPPLVLYVSCLAESLARDLAHLLQTGYEVQGIELFDFYPQTYHVELLAVLRKR